MNQINRSFSSIEQVAGQYLQQNDTKTKVKETGVSFEDVLRQQIGSTTEATSELKFSKHANMPYQKHLLPTKRLLPNIPLRCLVPNFPIFHHSNCEHLQKARIETFYFSY